MSILNRPFKDSSASRGIPKNIGPELLAEGKLSRSYDKNISKASKTLNIHFRKDGYFHFDFSNITGSKIKINKTMALKIANFILVEADGKTNMARKSKASSRRTQEANNRSPRT